MVTDRLVDLRAAAMLQGIIASVVLQLVDQSTASPNSLSLILAVQQADEDGKFKAEQLSRLDTAG